MIVSGTRDQRVAAIAQHQRGRVSRAQLVAVGLSAGAIQRRLRRGSLIREHPSVYQVGHAPTTRLGPETGALLSIRNGAVLSHHSAAALWQIGPADRQIQVLVRGGSGGRRAGVKVHRTALLDARDTHVRDGLPVTSPARTLLDCAGATSTRQLERMFTEALTLKLVTPADIEDVLAGSRSRTGQGALRALVDAEVLPAHTRSVAEERLLELIRRAQLPEPLVNAALHGFEVDLYWPAQGVVVEVDSYGFHTTRWAYERDCRKDAVLRGHGLHPTRFSARQVRDEPLLVIAQVAGALAGAVDPPPSTPTRGVRGAAAR